MASGSSNNNLLTIIYHDIFDYPLTSVELSIWEVGKSITGIASNKNIARKNNFYFVKGRENMIKRRIKNEKHSKEKLGIAKKASKLISKIPMVSFVGVTGALAMKNASKNSDIDLLIITEKDSLWTTRILVYLILFVFGFKIRSPLNKNEKDKLCLNMWLDETNLIWNRKDRNIYTSHEIAQIIPLVNKNKTYEKFLKKNKWILDYWPKSVKISSLYGSKLPATSYLLFVIEKLAFKLQYLYMEPKITREVITSTRAIFHPTDWGKKVLRRLNFVK